MNSRRSMDSRGAIIITTGIEAFHSKNLLTPSPSLHCCSLTSSPWIFNTLNIYTTGNLFITTSRLK